MIRTDTRRLWSALGVAGIVLWILAPVALVTLLTMRSMTATIDSPQAVLVHPEPNAGEVTRPVQIGLAWDTPGVAVAPTWNGVVQEILVRPGDAITDGTPIIRVDGVVRVAAQTTWPFSRSLTIGDSGEDVRQLAAFLRAREVDVPDTAEFTDTILEGVRNWAATISVADAKSVDSFDPAWVIFFSRDAVALSTDLVIGAPAPSPGTPVLELAPQLLDTVLLESGNQATDPASDASFAPQLEPTATALEAESLIIAGTTIPLDNTRQRVSVDALGTLARLVPAAETQFAAILSQASSENFWRLPAPTVVTGEGSRACVFVDRSGRETALTVNVVASTGGTLVVDAPLTEADNVLLFPTSKSITCP